MKIGRPSIDGPPLLRGLLRGGADAVIFDLGTNDDPANPGRLTADLAAAGSLAGSRCLVLATLNRPPLNGYSVDGLNHALEAFAAGRPGTVLVPWHAYAAREPSLLGPDHVHPTPAGYALRARLFASALGSCAGGPGRLPPLPAATRPAGGSRTLTSPTRGSAPPAPRPRPRARVRRRVRALARVSVWTIPPYGAVHRGLGIVLLATP